MFIRLLAVLAAVVAWRFYDPARNDSLARLDRVMCEIRYPMKNCPVLSPEDRFFLKKNMDVITKLHANSMRMTEYVSGLPWGKFVKLIAQFAVTTPDDAPFVAMHDQRVALIDSLGTTQ